MQVTKQSIDPTNVKLVITAEAAELQATHQAVLQRLASNVKLQGFRAGKAPLNLIEKNLDQAQLQNEFLQTAVNQLYVDAVEKESLRPVGEPNISVSKFVPFTSLEITAEVETVGDITLGEYKGLKVKRQTVKVDDAQVDETIENLRNRAAIRKPVERAAKSGDEVTIDFSGKDAKTDEAIAGADGKDYPLTLGSDSFIPGFETELISCKAGEDKTFTITFPSDYGVADLQKRKVVFAVTVKAVSELVLPELDDSFAATVGPFKTVDELKQDVRRELEAQANQDADRAYENELIEAVASKTTVALPAKLVDDEVERMELQEKQNVLYRGQTWQEHLDAEGVTEQEHRDKNRDTAEQRVRAGLVLGEIAEAEQVRVSSEEFEIRMQLYKGRYASDPQMMSELDKPENRRDIMSRMLTEKTLDKLKNLNPTK